MAQQIYHSILYHNGQFYGQSAQQAQAITGFMKYMETPKILRTLDDDEDFEFDWWNMQQTIPEIKGKTPEEVFDEIQNKI